MRGMQRSSAKQPESQWSLSTGSSRRLYAKDARPVATQGLMPVPFGLTPRVCGVIASDVANALSTTAAPLFRGAGTWQVCPMLS